jgi:replication factor C subunit 1
MSDKVLIDPFSFFSTAGPKIVETVAPAVKRPVPTTRDIENQNPCLQRQPEVKKIKTDTNDCPARMPGVKATIASVEKPHSVAELWVEKYKPKSIGDLVGNGQVIQKLHHWIKNWNSSSPVQSVRPGQENANARAALISGPPGIGKTSTAKLVCEAAGYTVLEFNASDTRSKTAIDEMANGLATNRVLFAGNGGRGMGSKVAVIMDEVDGMAGNGDRGGAGALIQLIKKSKLPVICVCNDRQDSKIRSLANHCYDLRFLKPTPAEVAGRAQTAANAEGLKLSHPELVDIAESLSCDIRQVLNHLQLIKTSGAKLSGKGQKDESMDPFQVVKGLFTSSVARTWDYAKRNELFYLDYDLIPLLVQQNYAKCVDKISDPRVLPALKKANEFITFGDVLSRAIHTDAQWALLPEYGTISTVAPSFACNNMLQFPEFPSWLGKQSTTGKNLRLIRELRSMVGAYSTCTSRNLKLSGYSDVLYEILVSKLGTPDGIKETIAMLDELGVPKDSLFEVLAETRFNWQTDPYAKVDSKVKASLTRTYNAGNHLVRAGNADCIKNAKKSSAPAAQSRKHSEFDDGDGEEPEIPEEEDNTASVLVKPAKASKKRN